MRMNVKEHNRPNIFNNFYALLFQKSMGNYVALFVAILLVLLRYLCEGGRYCDLLPFDLRRCHGSVIWTWESLDLTSFLPSWNGQLSYLTTTRGLKLVVFWLSLLLHVGGTYVPLTPRFWTMQVSLALSKRCSMTYFWNSSQSLPQLDPLGSQDLNHDTIPTVLTQTLDECPAIREVCKYWKYYVTSWSTLYAVVSHWP